MIELVEQLLPMSLKFWACLIVACAHLDSPFE